MGTFDTFPAVGFTCLARQAKFKYRQVKGNHKVCDSSNHPSCHLKTMIIHCVVMEEEQRTHGGRAAYSTCKTYLMGIDFDYVRDPVSHG